RVSCFFFATIRRPPSSPLFPYTTLFRSADAPEAEFGALCVAVAGAICIIPTLFSMGLTLWSRGRSAAEQLMAVMGGMGLRVGVEVGRAHVWTPVTHQNRISSFACKKKKH